MYSMTHNNTGFGLQLTEQMPWMRIYARKLCRNIVEAEDLVQSTLKRALEKQHLYNAGYALKGWLSKMMYNQFISEFCRKHKHIIPLAHDNDAFEIAVEETQTVQSELRRVRDAMTALSFMDHNILQLICMEGFSYSDTAKILKIPVGTVRSRLSRARRRLKEVLNDHEQTPATAH